jgi:adenylate cyclase
MLAPQLLRAQGSTTPAGGEDRVTKRRLLVRRLLSVLALTIVVTGLAAVGLHFDFLAGYQRRATDNLFPSASDSGRVAVVGIDQATIERFGTTLPREQVAQLITELDGLGAKVVAFDILYRSETTADQVAADAKIAQAIDNARGSVILGTEPELSGKLDHGVETTAALSPYAPGIVESNFTPAHVNVTPDVADGVVRSIKLVVEAPPPGRQFVPSLSLAAVMKFRGDSGPVIVRPDGVQVGDRLVPTRDAKTMVLNFSPDLSSTDKVISAVDVLDGKVPAAKVAGKIVFVGAVASTLGDTKTAPISKSTGIPGVLLHANAANTILTGTYLDAASTFRTLLWVAIVTAIIGTAVLLLPLWMSVVFALLVGGAYFVLFVIRFGQGEVLDIYYPEASILIAFVGALGLRYFGETRQRRRVTALFSQYVPEAVAQRLVDEDRAGAAAEGERLDMTVLFCDLRGFTALSESLEPSVVRTMLNHYYDQVTDVVLAMSGTLMKYVGDEVFAVWGAPLPDPDHPARALECAIAIQALTPRLNRELVELGCPEVSFGIGLNTGEAVAAHFGGGRRRQYDVVGDTVNVGARLCSQAGRGEIILSDQVLVRVPNPPEVEPVGPVALKGVSRELRLWRVVDPEKLTNVAESAVVAMGSAAASEGVAETRRSQE